MIIYRYYFGSFELNEATYNHLRGEDRNGTPSFIISNRYGHIHHKDFSDNRWSGDCFQLVQQIYGCSYNEALKIIDRDLGLGILPENNSGIYRKLKKELKVPDETSKRYSLIQVVTRKFTKEELEYWKQYGQSLEDLKANHIYSIKEAFLNKKRHPLAELRFAYLFENGYIKIYQPMEDKKRKWISNVPITTLDGKKNIENCCTAWITKSKKDMMTLKKFYPHVISTQNESTGCFSPENIEYIKNNSSRQILMFDNDSTGVRTSIEITNKYGFEYCNVPKKYFDEGITDWADWVAKYDTQIVRDYLISKKVLDK